MDNKLVTLAEALVCRANLMAKRGEGSEESELFKQLAIHLSASLLATREACKERDALAVENVGLHARTPVAYSYRYAWCETCEGFQDWRWELSKEKPPEWMLETGKVTNLVELFERQETPATYAAIAAIQAQGVEKFADDCESDVVFVEPEDAEHYELMAEHARQFAEQLRKECTHD